MKDIIIKLTKSDKDLRQVVALSKEFEKENCCNGIVSDDFDYFKKKKVAVAKIGDAVVGYAYGSFGVAEKKSTFAEAGDKYYSIEEIYTAHCYRNQGIGKKLFEFLEQYAQSQKCKNIRLNAVSKDYKRLLKFYIEELGMCFWSAYLCKRL